MAHDHSGDHHVQVSHLRLVVLRRILRLNDLAHNRRQGRSPGFHRAGPPDHDPTAALQRHRRVSVVLAARHRAVYRHGVLDVVVLTQPPGFHVNPSVPPGDGCPLTYGDVNVTGPGILTVPSPAGQVGEDAVNIRRDVPTGLDRDVAHALKLSDVNAVNCPRDRAAVGDRDGARAGLIDVNAVLRRRDVTAVGDRDGVRDRCDAARDRYRLHAGVTNANAVRAHVNGFRVHAHRRDRAAVGDHDAARAARLIHVDAVSLRGRGGPAYNDSVVRQFNLALAGETNALAARCDVTAVGDHCSARALMINANAVRGRARRRDRAVVGDRYVARVIRPSIHVDAVSLRGGGGPAHNDSAVHQLNLAPIRDQKAVLARGDVTRVHDRQLATATTRYSNAVVHGVNRRPAGDGMGRRVGAIPHRHKDPVVQHALSLRPDSHPAAHVHRHRPGRSSWLPDENAMARSHLVRLS